MCRFYSHVPKTSELRGAATEQDMLASDCNPPNTSDFSSLWPGFFLLQLKDLDQLLSPSYEIIQKWADPDHFLFIFVLFQQHVIVKTEGFIGIRTRIIGKPTRQAR